jgi:hypothetical protein
MRYLFLILAACGSDSSTTADAGIDAAPDSAITTNDSGVTTVNCVIASKAIIQDHAPCTINNVGTIPGISDDCPLNQWAYCGDNADCPTSGWEISCEAPEPGFNCVYGNAATQCGPEFATFPMSQYLEGRRGILTVTAADIDMCEFRACQ